MSCKQGIKVWRIDTTLIRPPIQCPSEHITGREDAFQMEFVPELPPSGGYESIVTAMDVFSRYLFAYHTRKQDDKTVAWVTINIKTEREFLPKTIIPDKGSALVS